MQKITFYHILTITILGSIFSCKIGPEYNRPQSDISDQVLFINDNQDKISDHNISFWWKNIEDPVLDKYIEDLLKDNLSIKAAAQRVNQSREKVNIEKGGFFPNLSVGGEASRGFTTSAGSRSYANNYSANLETAWEVDLFGRIRKSVSSKKAEFTASKYDQEALQQSLIADLVKVRVSIAINKKLLKLAKLNAQNQKKIYDLVKSRYHVGAKNINLLDVYLAEDSYNKINTDINLFERNLYESIYRLDILLGKAPGSTKTKDSFPILSPPDDVALCLPASLIDRRPDIRASELRLIAANSDIGVAVADLYPNLNIVGSIGFTSSDSNNLFNSNNLAGSILGGITSKIFQGGSLRANVKLKKARAEELALQYSQNILQALFEVETALKNEQEITLELKKQERSVRALKNAEKISKLRYRKGSTSLKDYLETRTRRYQSEQNLLNIWQQKWNSRISLYLALGGDWLNQNKDLNQCKISI